MPRAVSVVAEDAQEAEHTRAVDVSRELRFPPRPRYRGDPGQVVDLVGGAPGNDVAERLDVSHVAVDEIDAIQERR